VTRAEVEDLAAASLVDAAGAEDFAAGEPADEDQLVGLGNEEVLAVGLLMLEDDLLADAAGNRMALLDDPEDLLVAGFAPFSSPEGVPMSLPKILEAWPEWRTTMPMPPMTCL